MAASYWPAWSAHGHVRHHKHASPHACCQESPRLRAARIHAHWLGQSAKPLQPRFFEMSPQSEEDHFTLGFHGAPSDDELRTWSYVQLCSRLESAQPGTVKHMVIEAEKRRRDSEQLAVPDHAAKPTPNPPEHVKHWYNKPIGQVGIGVLIIAIGALVTHLFRSYFGLAP